MPGIKSVLRVILAGAALSALPLQAFALEVPIFGQRWDPWKNDQLGTGSNTIGSHGCAVSAVAMVLKYYGKNTDPRDLNNWLRNNGGFSQGDLILWSKAASYASGVTYAGSVDWLTVAADLNAINAEVDAGYPAIVHVKLSGQMHWVVIKARSGSTYYINDPWYGDTTATLNARYGSPTAAIYGLRKYHGTAGISPAAIRWTSLPSSDKWYRSNEYLNYHVDGARPNEVREFIDGTQSGGPYDTSDGYFRLSYATPGRHEYEAAARNSANGNNWSYTGRHAVSYDPIAPSARRTGGAEPGVWTREGATVNIEGVDALSGAKRHRIRWAGFDFSDWIWGATNTTILPEGKRELLVEVEDNAWDGAGQNGNSAVVSLGTYWNDRTSPLAEAPSASKGSSASYQVTLSASDSLSGVALIKLLVDGVEVGSVNGASGTVTWNAATAAPGPHALTAVATDNAGNKAISAGAQVTVGEGKPRVLWTEPGGRARVMRADEDPSVSNNSPVFGPYAGWRAKLLATGKDNLPRLLWEHTSGQISLWTMDQDNQTYQSVADFGPYDGWRVQDMEVGSDNKPRLMWRHTNGMISLWTMNPQGTQFEKYQDYGPYPGWSAQAVSVGTDGLMRVAWTHTNGKLSLWKLNENGSFASVKDYGPYDGWRAVDLEVGADNRELVTWKRTNGQISLWTLEPNGAFASVQDYGAYTSWDYVGMSVGANGKIRVLWSYQLGPTASLWKINSPYDFTVRDYELTKEFDWNPRGVSVSAP